MFGQHKYCFKFVVKWLPFLQYTLCLKFRLSKNSTSVIIGQHTDIVELVQRVGIT